MKPRFPLALRLSTLPAAACLAVAILSGLTVLDLARSRRGEDAEKAATSDAPPPAPCANRKVPLAAGVPVLSESEALDVLKERPHRAAVARLFPIQRHREALFKILLSRESPEDARLYLLSAFAGADPAKGLEASRSIAAETDLEEGPLLLSALEVLSRNGEPKDLALFCERAGESTQLRTMREEYRDALRDRSRAGAR